jgi:insulysin
MYMMSKRFCYIWSLAIVVCLGLPPASKASEANKHPLDKSESRKLVLENDLKVLLIRDPKFNKSAASLVVGAGSLSDFGTRQGMAHFLEHMLFMGTEKFPGVDEYAQFIADNGGRRNAYTSRDHTNYFFDVNHDALEGALDRFSQFFVAPLFTEEYTEREMNAVNSEFQKNLENDGWRQYQLWVSLFREDHPGNHFNIGSLETLGETKQEDLLAFYKENYSADRMGLVILGKVQLDTLEQLARKYFSSIESKGEGRLQYPPDFLPEKKTFRLVQVEPVKDLRALELTFGLPGYGQHFRSKPAAVLGSLVGHEGKGSLLSLLKNKGLATVLSAGGHLESLDYGAFSIDVSLTPKGLENYKEVVSLSFAYINMLQKQEYPGFYFQEMRSKAKLDEVYSDKGEGSSYASGLGRRLNRYPLEVAETLPYLFEKEDPDAYRMLLSHLRPDNMVAMLTAKGVETTDSEKYYGTKYSYTEDEAFFKELQDVQAVGELHLPEPNPFMPRETAIPDRQLKDGVKPSKVVDEEGLVLYHSEDFKFLRPKASLIYKIRFPREKINLRYKVLLDTYSACVTESLNELAYPARLAGLNYGFSGDVEGVDLTISGFDESVPKLFENVLDHMKEFKISEETFEALKDRSVRGLKNFPKQDAWQITRYLNYEVLQEVDFRPEDQLTILKELTLEDVRNFAKTLYEMVYIEGLAHGNIGTDGAMALTRQLQKSLNMQPLSAGDAFEQRYLGVAEAESLWVVSQLEVNNSCFWRQYHAGPVTAKSRATALILNTFIDRPFFTELRTNQQLGYIVWAGIGPTRDRDDLYGYFIIQSGEYPADVIEDRASAFIETYTTRFAELKDSDFETLRKSAAEELKKKDKSIAARAGRFNTEAFEFDGDFERNNDALKALEGLTKDQVGAFLKTVLSMETRRMRTTLAYAKEHKAVREVKPSFENLSEWKKSREYK